MDKRGIKALRTSRNEAARSYRLRGARVSLQTPAPDLKPHSTGAISRLHCAAIGAADGICLRTAMDGCTN